MNTFWTISAYGWAGAAALLFLLWLDQVRSRNATLVDVGWTLALAGCGVLFALAADGSPAQRALAGILAGIWGIRLAWHLVADRVLGRKPEDARYQTLRAAWGANANLHFAWFYQLQALAAAGLSLPYLLIARHDAPIASVQWAGVALWLFAIGMETLADRQLAAFRAEPANRGTTCRAGLWRYSRHPNYFFEWLVWVAIALIASPTADGLWAWLAPVIMFILVTKISGIPWAEMQSIKSRGDDYRRYQRETSTFIPWFPRKA
jgi:steroid 5-alpha reductase family enzyme